MKIPIEKAFVFVCFSVIPEAKLYIPSTLNIELILWHTHPYLLQGRHHRENLVATSAMVGRISPLVRIGLRYLKM
jgi:hypothetical protein